MGKTFLSLDGRRYRAENYTGVDYDEDIVSGDVTNYYVCYDGEPMVEVSAEVYNALVEYYKEMKES